MAIRFSAEIKIENKNHNIAISFTPKLKRKKIIPTYYFSFFSFKLQENTMWNSFLIVSVFKFVNWLMVNDYYIVFSYRAFIANTYM